MWCAFDVLLCILFGARCVGGFRGVLWVEILERFVRGDGGGVVVPLFRARISGLFSGCMLGGEVWWLVGEVQAIGASRNFAISSLPPCSVRISDAFCGVGVN